MKLAAVLFLVAPFILGETFAVSHLRCGGEEYVLPLVDSARANCLGESNTACRVLCTYVNLNVINGENNQVNLNALSVWSSSFSKGLQEVYGAVAKNCPPDLLTLPSKMDAECSAYGLYLSCQQEHIKKQCEILAPSVFS